MAPAGVPRLQGWGAVPARKALALVGPLARILLPLHQVSALPLHPGHHYDCDHDGVDEDDDDVVVDNMMIVLMPLRRRQTCPTSPCSDYPPSDQGQARPFPPLG